MVSTFSETKRKDNETYEGAHNQEEEPVEKVENDATQNEQYNASPEYATVEVEKSNQFLYQYIILENFSTEDSQPQLINSPQEDTQKESDLQEHNNPETKAENDKDGAQIQENSTV